MKNILLTFVFLSTITNVFATCQDTIAAKISKLEDKGAKILIAAAVGMPVLLVAPAVGAGYELVVGAIGVNRNIKLGNLKKVSAVIEQAYSYRNTGYEGKTLIKLLKKMNRKLENKITIEHLSAVIITSNESNNLCKAKNLGSYARSVSVDL